MGRYVEAEKCFKWARAVSPHRVEDMDVYSTTLFVTNPKPETRNPKPEPETRNPKPETKTQAWLCRAVGDSEVGKVGVGAQHLRKAVELSFLAQEVVAMDRLSPQAWCVMGNCMSEHKEHEAALNFFTRALQLQPEFVYAHTLSGHEHVALEQYDEGMRCYREALRLDHRHYNAW